MDRLELVTRNVEEVVTIDELKKLLDEKPHPTVYVGYEPSGNVHLGHMITVNKLIDCQKAGFNVTVLLADLHAYLNRKGTMEEIEKIAEYNKRCFIALGLSEESTRFVLGSSYQLSPEYEMNVLRMACETTVNTLTDSAAIMALTGPGGTANESPMRMPPPGGCTSQTCFPN